MPNFTDITGLAAVAAVTALSLMSLPGISRLSNRSAIWLSAGLFALMLIPFGALPLAGYVRGVTGDFSVTTLLILVGGCATQKFRHGMEICEPTRTTWILLAVVALAFYPMVLGLSRFDPYQLGYGNAAFIVMLLLLAILAWLTKNDLIAMCISLALMAWTVGWYESDNLWDYLLDPFISVYALVALFLDAIKSSFGNSTEAA
ncbi:MAG: hypothetical protein WA632_13350 [Gallionella sp.]